MSALDAGRISLAAGCVGIAPGLPRRVRRLRGERRQFGRPIAGFQLVQELIADMAVETEAARLLDLACGGARRRGERLHARGVGREVLRQRGGGAGRERRGAGPRRLRLRRRVSRSGKYLRDARVTTLYEGTSQIQKLIIGRALTGENAFV